MSTAPQTHPRQAWAHKDGKINMLLHGKQQVIRDPMTWLLIHEAFGRFGMAHDEARFDVLESLFTADAVLEVADGSGTPYSRLQGREKLVARWQSVLPQQTDQRRHCMTNILIENLTDKDCHALAFGVVTGAADGLFLAASVYYQAQLRLESDGMWRFNYFFIGLDTYAGRKPDISRTS